MAKLNELFEVVYGNKFDLNKMAPRPRMEGGVSFVGRAEKNHGVSATVTPLKDVPPYSAGLITVALGGSKLLCSFIQEHPFYTAQNVAVLRPLKPMSFAQKLYICLCIRANRFRYGAFGREANRTLRVLEVPDLSEFPAWIAGAADSVIEASAAAAVNSPTPGLAIAEWQKFVMGQLFDIRKGSRLTKANQVPGETPYIGAIDRNNGVSNYISHQPHHAGGTVTVNYNGSVAEAFYQPEPFWASDDVNVLYPKTRAFSPAIALFLTTVIRQEKYRYSYGRKWGLERMKVSTIKLPTKPGTNPPEPDWDYMERFIQTRPYSSRLEN